MESPNGNRPLAERLRPQTLDEVIGQLHIVGNGKIVREIIASQTPTSLILWGPPGSGKTTLARIIAQATEAEFIELSAVTAGKADVLKVIGRAEQNQRLGNRLFLASERLGCHRRHFRWPAHRSENHSR